MELNEQFKASICLAMEDRSLNFEETFLQAVKLYVAVTPQNRSKPLRRDP